MARHTVHPRVCGEQVCVTGRYLAKYGSSPRVRGTDQIDATKDAPLRFIPACAGNRLHRDCQCSKQSVHPRVCGEQEREPNTNFLRAGSSPRVRGTAAICAVFLRVRRFIPACAGNSLRARGSVGEWAVHPRVCGEQIFNRGFALLCAGSSPRVRGTEEKLKKD